jgi:hypothetical protein
LCEGRLESHLSAFAMRSNLILFWMAAATCLIAHAAIVRSVFRTRQSGRWVADATWAIVPAIGLLAVFIWTWHVLHAIPPA